MEEIDNGQLPASFEPCGPIHPVGHLTIESYGEKRNVLDGDTGS
jgi:hypothetical protein